MKYKVEEYEQNYGVELSEQKIFWNFLMKYKVEEYEQNYGVELSEQKIF